VKTGFGMWEKKWEKIAQDRYQKKGPTRYNKKQ
jgi:hypothetical protein